MLVDSHCHLDLPDYALERDAVVERARAAGVGMMVTICTRVAEFAAIAAIADRYKDVYCSLGTHPDYAAQERDVTTDALVALAGQTPRVVGIGECGLDYHEEPVDRAAQAEVFRRHIRAAASAGLPLLVHTRDAEEDTMRILREEAPHGGLSGLLHCFSGSPRMAEDALDFGFSISLSGIVTFKNAHNVHEVATLVPADRLLVETDAPFLAPVPHRGRRNEPAYVVHTAARVAELRGISPELLASQTTANFLRLFTRVPPPTP